MDICSSVPLGRETSSLLLKRLNSFGSQEHPGEDLEQLSFPRFSSQVPLELEGLMCQYIIFLLEIRLHH